MIFQGTFSHRNLHGSEKIQDDNGKSHLHPGPGNHPPVQIVTVDGVDYIVKQAGGNYCNDNKLNKYNNKTVQIDGTFIGGICFMKSITQVGP